MSQVASNLHVSSGSGVHSSSWAASRGPGHAHLPPAVAQRFPQPSAAAARKFQQGMSRGRGTPNKVNTYSAVKAEFGSNGKRSEALPHWAGGSRSTGAELRGQRPVDNRPCALPAASNCSGSTPRLGRDLEAVLGRKVGQDVTTDNDLSNMVELVRQESARV